MSGLQTIEDAPIESVPTRAGAASSTPGPSSAEPTTRSPALYRKLLTGLVAVAPFLAVALLVGFARREHFDDQLWRNSQMTGFISGIRESVAGHPNNIRRHIIILAKDQTWRREHGAYFAFEIPLNEKVGQKTARVLVFVTRLSGHVEFSVDDFVALAVIRHQR